MNPKDINPGSLLVDIVAASVKKIRNRPKAVARRAQKAARKAAKQKPSDEVTEEFNSTNEDVSMDALNGAVKSRLMWLGLVQVAYGLFELWANGALTADSAGPVLSGALTMFLRAVTTDSLADKAK